jgi:carbon-monoxide dehydrogenase large subunit
MGMLGRRVLRSEDERFLIGQGQYVDNIRDPRFAEALCVTFVKSQIANGKIKSIDVEAARLIPGVLAVLTAEDIDIPPIPPLWGVTHPKMFREIVASKRVRFVGEIIAVVIANNNSAAVDAAAAVVEDIDILEVLSAPEESLGSSNLLFEDAGTNVTYSAERRSEGIADSTDLFEGCDVVVHQKIINQRLASCPLEVRSAAAIFEDGRLHCWLSTQTPQLARDTIAKLLGLENHEVRVIAGPDVGGGFGPKDGWYPEEILVAWASKKYMRPMRWIETRSENMVGLYHGRGQIQRLSIGGLRNGKIVAYEMQLIQDAGAYPSLGAWLPELTLMMATGVYEIERFRSSAVSVMTNTTPMNAYRGAGRPEATAAIERMVDVFSAEIGMDSLIVRRMNVMSKFSEPRRVPTGAEYDSGDYIGVLDKLLESVDVDSLRSEQRVRRQSKDPIQLGIGFALYVEVTGGPEAGSENAAIELMPDGCFNIYTGTSPHGQGHATSWAMLGSDYLGVDFDSIRVIHGDTDLVPEGVGTYGSRSLQLGGSAVVHTTEIFIDKAKSVAAELMEADIADIQFDASSGTFSVIGTPSRTLTWNQISASLIQPLRADAKYEAKGATFPFGAHMAVVEIDTETGKVKLRSFYSVDDAGQIINPLIAEGQRHGGIAQGISQALYEKFEYSEDGAPLTSTFVDYAFPSAAEFPNFQLFDSVTPTSANILGVKGIGESGTIGSTAAVQNAVIDGLKVFGIKHLDMPLTPFNVWSAISAVGQ